MSGLVRVLMVSVALLVGCADGPGGAGGAVVVNDGQNGQQAGVGEISPAEVVGSWQLTRIDDQSLPVDVSTEEGVSRTVDAGRLTVESGGAWIYRYDYTRVDGMGAKSGSTGTAGLYRVESERPLTVSLVDEGSAETWIAAMPERNVLSVQMDGHALRFTKVR